MIRATMMASVFGCWALCGLFGAHPLVAQVDAIDDYLHLTWDSPSANHHGSMPLGNGDISLNVWVEHNGDLQFYIGKTDAWDDNARLLKVGKLRIHLEPNPFADPSPFQQTLSLRDGTLKIQAGAGTTRTEVEVWVDANHPVIQVTAQSAGPITATAVVECWRTQPVELAELQTSDVLNNRVVAGQQQANLIVEPDIVLRNQNQRIGWFHHNVKSVGPQLLAELQGLSGFPQPDPLLHRTFGAMVTAAGGERVDDTRLRSPLATTHRFNIFVLTQHPATPNRWLAEIESVMQRVESLDFATRRAAHRQWWEAFWARSWIRATVDPHAVAATPSIVPANAHPVRIGSDQSDRSGFSGDIGRLYVNGQLVATRVVAAVRDEAAYVSQMYHLQRFITACAGRGAYPIKFNGSIFTVPPGETEADPDYRRWGPGYWWQNTRLPYISLCTSGDYDLMRPLFHMYADELLPLCKYRTRLYLGHDGAYYPECIMFWGAVFGETYGWTPFEQRQDKLQESGWHKWEWVGGLELCWMMLDYYDHTCDRDFLRQTLLPFTREILTFFEQHYATNSQGQLVMQPSQALETWWQCTNPAPELAGCLAVTERLLAMPQDDLVSAADREAWQRFRDKLPPLPLRDIDGQPALAPAESFEHKSNIENPELYPVFPFRLIALNRPHLEWGLNALDHRWDRGHAGWRQDDIFMAYLGRTDEARRAVVERARNHDPNERFPAFWGPNYDWTPDQDHGGVLMKTLQAMLLQTDGPHIYLLPAWPKAWNVDFRLLAPQQTVIEGVYRHGELQSLRVTPEQRQRDVIVISP